MRWSVRIVKRMMDLLMSSVGLCLTVPFYPLLALLIKLSSRGPIFYVQERVQGLIEDESGAVHFKTFRMYKFRTMTVGADRDKSKLITQQGDSRVTGVGRFLRKTRLDELPQLWHVLLGQMSLIGPRPERPDVMANLAAAVPFFEERMRFLKPGITGLAQVYLGYSGKMDKNNPLFAMKDILTNPFGLDQTEGSIADDMRTKLLFDLAYSAAMENFWTFLSTDLKIIFETPRVMLFGLGR